MNHPPSITACAISSLLVTSIKIIKHPITCQNPKKTLSSSNKTPLWDICSKVKYDQNAALSSIFVLHYAEIERNNK